MAKNYKPNKTNTNTRVSACGLDYHRAFLEYAAALCLLYHRKRGSVLYASRGIEIFKLAEKIRALSRALALAEIFGAEKGSIAYELCY